jgi:hypothetical protein
VKTLNCPADFDMGLLEEYLTISNTMKGHNFIHAKI